MKIIRKQHKSKSLILIALFILLTCMTQVGCKKWVEVPAPYTSTNSANVYATDAAAAAVLTGIYTKISLDAVGSASLSNVPYWTGLSADEFGVLKTSATTTQVACYINALTTQLPVDIWTNIYPYIYDTNAAIAGLNASTALTPAVKKQLLGEAQFMRAWLYFYLVNLYGDVPLILGTDYTQTATVARTPKANVYAQIVADLKSAQSLLSPNYLDATVVTKTIEKTRPNQSVATAFLARVYLYLNDWSDAATQASSLISNTSYSLSPLTGTGEVFTKNSSEAIWQLQPVNSGYNTNDARLYVLPATGPGTGYAVYLNNTLINSFETGDLRRTNWVGSVTVSSGTYYYAYKYKVNANNVAVTSAAAMTEYTMLLRLSEQYLIRAEAEANLGDMTDAANDLNVIRKRAGLSNSTTLTATSTLSQAMAAIMHERQVELFTEGHRWFDLKRTGSIDAVMGGATGATSVKGGTWNSFDQLYPIALAQLNYNPALVQNTGY